MVTTPAATEKLTRKNASDDDVVYQSSVPPSSIGFQQHEFFMRLGHPSTVVGSEQQELEQVYLLKNMHKAGLFEAAQIAIKHNIGIAVRGTGLLAHMGIESGNPTKSVEFKNKTSTPVDLLLCPELAWKDLRDQGVDVTRDRIVYVGDTVDDMLSAKRFGGIAVGVIPPGHDIEALAEVLAGAGADAVVSDVNTLPDIVTFAGA